MKKTLHIKAFTIDDEGLIVAQTRSGGIPTHVKSVADVKIFELSASTENVNEELMIKAAVNIAAVLMYPVNGSTAAIKKIVKLGELGPDLLRKATDES